MRGSVFLIPSGSYGGARTGYVTNAATGWVVDVVVTEVVWLQIRREGRYHREKKIMGAKRGGDLPVPAEIGDGTVAEVELRRAKSRQPGGDQIRFSEGKNKGDTWVFMGEFRGTGAKI
jgi:hypothetical protein